MLINLLSAWLAAHTTACVTDGRERETTRVSIPPTCSHLPLSSSSAQASQSHSPLPPATSCAPSPTHLPSPPTTPTLVYLLVWTSHPPTAFTRGVLGFPTLRATCRLPDSLSAAALNTQSPSHHVAYDTASALLASSPSTSTSLFPARAARSPLPDLLHPCPTIQPTF